MACPFFRPSTVADGARVARAPLGALYTGSCATGALETVADLCNFGYARGRCPSFPAESSCDAVRFSVSRDVNADPLEIIWIHEQKYSPVAHGVLHYSRARGAFLEPIENPVFASQALAFAARWVHV